VHRKRLAESDAKSNRYDKYHILLVDEKEVIVRAHAVNAQAVIAPGQAVIAS
jgi:hypothetical protein